LGEVEPIDRAIGAWRRALRDPNRGDVDELGRAVDKRALEPVRRFLGPARHLLISPDGALNLIPFAALVDEHRRHLVESYTITYLSSGRDLLRLQVPRASRGGPVVIADPTLGPPSTRESRIQFNPLPGVRAEVEALRDLLPHATFLTRDRATKSALQHISAPSILHVATHGFFLEGNAPIREPQSTNRDRARLGMWVAQVDNPLLRSGLALAGANAGMRDSSDGVLTALEAADLDLWGTELVVLSACDTGVGEVRNGDGVYGLRRALVLAGSESQMMTLWPVSDVKTRDVIVGYYSALGQGDGRGDALRTVQTSMLRRRPRTHPYYWASFILSGQWAPLTHQP
jgi:CHAT domain-containing protein